MNAFRDVIIVGASGFGREVFQYASEARAAGWPYRVMGFLDDDPDALSGSTSSPPILGATTDLTPFAGYAFVVALGNPDSRRLVAERVASSGGHLVSLIHPTAYVAPSAHVGPGIVACPFAVIGVDSHVGGNVAVNIYGSVGHDATVGDHAVLSPYTSLLGASRVGDLCMLGTHVTVTPGVSIGARSKVAAGSVVTRDCQPGSLVAGNPAKGRVMYRVPT